MKKQTQNLLTPLGWLFNSVIKARRKLYENGNLKTHDLGVPVVSVGNLTVGGTGKTPLVAYVARILADNGHRVCVLTRGYKRENPNQRVLVSDGTEILTDAKRSGDEPFELANKLLGVASIIADKRRAEAGKWARQNWGITAFVLDDGFQHWQVKRDLDIVTVDATNPFGNEKLLPAGILRENPTALARADCVVITRCDLADDLLGVQRKVQKYANCPIILSKMKLIPLRLLKKNIEQSKEESTGLFAFCGIGNPNNFFKLLREEDYVLSGTKIFPDHHSYTQKDVEIIEAAARQCGANILFTTAKDAVKLENLGRTLPCAVFDVEIEFGGVKTLAEMLASL